MVRAHSVRAHSVQPSHDGTAHSGVSHGGTAHATRQATPRGCRAAAVALFVVLALITLLAARLGVSGLFAQLAQAETERSAAAAPIGTQAIGHIEQQLYSSLRYAPGNPWALEQMGALELARMRAATDPREAVALTRDARTRLREALSQRPTSPFLWAKLALAKLYLEEVDTEFFAALRHADALGPWEPTVQQASVFVGLAAWRDLDPEMRQALVRTLERGALRNAEQMARIVKSYRRTDLLCGIRKYNPFVGRECGKVP